MNDNEIRYRLYVCPEGHWHLEVQTSDIAVDLAFPPEGLTQMAKDIIEFNPDNYELVQHGH
jgi:hypothetical protein